MRSKNLTVALVLTVLAGMGCTSTSSPNYGASGSGAGSGGAGSGGAGAPSGFMAIDPCSNVSDYVTSPTTITTTTSLRYTPQCLKVSKGTAVTIEASTTHPLAGLSTGSPNNPIPAGGKLSNQTITFSAAGFFPYQCTVHFSSGMKGVVWVQ